jgi:TatD DNase family protein
MYIDSHAHLTSPQVLLELEQILLRAQELGLDKIVNICTDRESLKEGIKLSEQHPWIYNTAATTPHDVEKEGEDFFPVVQECARSKKLVAVGETGLDYHYEHSNRKVQKKFLIQYFQLARECQLPLVIHCREAFSDIFSIADEEYRNFTAVINCFNGDMGEAKRVLDRGWYLSFSGIITFKKSEALREVAGFAPLDRILIETDTPYLAPQSKRGKQNEPAFIQEIAVMLAQIKKMLPEDIARATSENACKFFPFSKLN